MGQREACAFRFDKRVAGDVDDDFVERDLKAFEEQLPSLLKTKPGQFVLIQGGRVQQNTFTSEAAALAAGFAEYGDAPFLVQMIEEPPKAIVRSDGTLEICRG